MTKTFKVEDRNTYSLASIVKPEATTSVAQFIQLQTLCYYFDIAITCSESRQHTCDLLTELNNLAQTNKLPRRQGQKGRAYLNKDGVMLFSNQHYQPYPINNLINDNSSRKLTLEQIKYINNALLKNYKEKGLKPEEKAITLIPANVTLESITRDMLVIVKCYKVTFNLNKDIRELYSAQQKCYLAINANEQKFRRSEKGESYVDTDNIIKFKTIETPDKPNAVVEEPTASTVLESMVPSAPSLDCAAETYIEEYSPVIYIESRLNADKTKRLVFFGDKDNTRYLEFSPRTTSKTYTFEIVKEASEIYDVCIIKVDKRAASLVDAYNGKTDDFSGPVDIAIKEFGFTCDTVGLELLDKRDPEYLSFIEVINNELA